MSERDHGGSRNHTQTKTEPPKEIMSSKQPTNYAHFREAAKLALDAEDSEDTETVLETLDEAIANNADLLEFPNDDLPYSALIVHEGGSSVESGIVDYFHDGQTLVVEYVGGSTEKFLYGNVEDVASEG